MNRIGIDIGGSSAKLGVVTSEGAVLRRDQVPTHRELGSDTLTGLLAEAVSRLRDEQTVGLGVAAPGFRRADGEGVVNVGNLPHIDGYPLRSRLENATGLPTVLDNDANAAALGEFRYGAGQGVSRLLVMTIGTGIGAGMVVNGAVLRVCAEGLGDPGHIIVRAGGPECTCGGRGCAEALAAVPAIRRRVAELRKETALPEYVDIVTAALTGNPAASRALADAGALLGQTLASLVHVLGPNGILLGGGGIDIADELLLTPIREALFAHVQPYFGLHLRLERAALGNDAGLVGAAALAASVE
jgi:glucokinase